MFNVCHYRKHIRFGPVCVTYVSMLRNFLQRKRRKICSSKLNNELTFLFSRPTFKRIIRNRSTEQFSGLPYIYALLNCLICLWYGMPLVSPGIMLVATVNSVGAVFQLIYVSIYIAYADKAMKVTIS